MARHVDLHTSAFELCKSVPIPTQVIGQPPICGMFEMSRVEREDSRRSASYFSDICASGGGVVYGDPDSVHLTAVFYLLKAKSNLQRNHAIACERRDNGWL
jgi:hypothetical protein